MTHAVQIQCVRARSAESEGAISDRRCQSRPNERSRRQCAPTARERWVNREKLNTSITKQAARWMSSIYLRSDSGRLFFSCWRSLCRRPDKRNIFFRNQQFPFFFASEEIRSEMNTSMWWMIIGISLAFRGEWQSAKILNLFLLLIKVQWSALKWKRNHQLQVPIECFSTFISIYPTQTFLLILCIKLPTESCEMTQHFGWLCKVQLRET